MKPFLIVYGTTDGHTRKIVEAMAETIRRAGSGVVAFEARVAPKNLDPKDYHGVLVAASVHAGGYQRGVYHWVKKNAETLNRMKTAFISVCLGVLQKDDPKVQADLDRILGRFLVRSRWAPQEIHRVAGATPYTRYGFFKKWIIQRIARKAGGGTDTSRDYEYTDWQALKATVQAFVAAANRAPNLSA
jgi:menaquinone-dependent protoporphyrinogen oxidase